ncbi:phage tail assembly chaperone [Aureibacillus halotolerans]|uniref:XkdN-like tail assembly chaperone n=1 Tax=Aureibacillus halotolerans TaxID=1508390 RepID=A0A4R6TUF6_9BACI|nr:phage portal protein [Aureibacillus halotolerans]TDQ35284.1 XkdN-like tail assembly chaperone [Aureibacillus halotolerans]
MSEKQTKSMAYFMKGQSPELPTSKAAVSNRFKDEDGNIIEFEFKAIGTSRVQEIGDMCTNDKGVFDNQRFVSRVAVESTTYPNFKDEDLLKSYGLQDPIEVAEQVLNIVGDFNRWVGQAQKVNGMVDFDELVEEAKN